MTRSPIYPTVLSIALMAFGVPTSPSSADVIDLAPILFGATVEICAMNVPGSGYTATATHGVNGSFLGTLTDNRQDSDCDQDPTSTKESRYSSYRIDSDGTIRVNHELLICLERNTAENGAKQIYEGIYIYSPRTIEFGNYEWHGNSTGQTYTWVPGPNSQASPGIGTYTYETFVTTGWEGGRRVLWHHEKYNSSYDKTKKYDIDARRLISMTDHNTGQFYKACPPSGGNCSRCDEW